MQWELDRGVLRITYGENCELAEITGIVAQGLRRVDAGLGVLIDAREAIRVRSLEEISAAIHELTAMGPRIIGIAVVVASGLHYGRTRQAGAYGDRSGIGIRPFWDEGEALEWLSRQVEESDPN